MKNIFLIGGSGFLGYYLLKEIKKNNLFCYLNKTKFKDTSLKIVRFNLIDFKELKKFILKNKINLIINLSSIANVDFCEKNKKHAYNVHVNIPRLLTKASLLYKLKVIHISTDHLFDGKIKSSYSEKSNIKPLNYYAKTKSYGEKIIFKNKENLIIRTNFFGANKVNYNSFSDVIIFNLKKNPVYLWKDVYFSPIHIKNLCFIINFLIKKNAKGIYNVSSKKISKYHLGILIAKKIKLDFKKIIPTHFDSKKFVNRPRNMSLLNKKLIKRYPNLKKYLLLNAQINLLKKDY